MSAKKYTIPKHKAEIQCCDSFLKLVNSAVNQYLATSILPSLIISNEEARIVYQIGQQAYELFSAVGTFLKGQHPFPKPLLAHITQNIPAYKDLRSLSQTCIQKLLAWNGVLRFPLYQFCFSGKDIFFQSGATSRSYGIAPNSLFRLPPHLRTDSTQKQLESIYLKTSLLEHILTDLQIQPKAKVFLAFDTFILTFAYHIFQPREQVYQLPVTRRELFGSYESIEYFELFRIINDSALLAATWDEFIGYYKEKFAALIEDPRVMKASKKVFNNLQRISAGEILIIDTGMQGTFALFAAASLGYWEKMHSDQQEKADILLISVYPWLRSIFQTKIFSQDSRIALLIENSAMNDEARSKYFGETSPQNVYNSAERETEEILHALSHRSDVDG